MYIREFAQIKLVKIVCFSPTLSVKDSILLNYVYLWRIFNKVCIAYKQTRTIITRFALIVVVYFCVDTSDVYRHSCWGVPTQPGAKSTCRSFVPIRGTVVRSYSLGVTISTAVDSTPRTSIDSSGHIIRLVRLLRSQRWRRFFVAHVHQLLWQRVLSYRIFVVVGVVVDGAVIVSRWGGNRL